MNIFNDIGLRAVDPILRLLENIRTLFYNIFVPRSGYAALLVHTIIANEYLLISVSLLLCGFVIGIIKRLISL